MSQFLPHIRGVFKLIKANKESLRAEIETETNRKEKKRNNPKLKSEKRTLR